MDEKRSSNTNITKAVTTVEPQSEREIIVKRSFNAPARIVFAAWSKAELFKQWWVPKSLGLSLLSCEMDVRAGGKYRLVFSHGDSEMAFFGTYIEVTPHSRLVWTNEESGEAGQVTTVTLKEQGGKTLMVLHELYASKEARDAGLRSGAYDGMGETFEQLDDVLFALGAETEPS
jgi:uncharacterized protein YndB with AHSA1/START domain